MTIRGGGVVKIICQSVEGHRDPIQELFRTNSGTTTRSRAPRPPRAPGHLRRLRDSGHYGTAKAAPLGTADNCAVIGRGPAVTPLAAKAAVKGKTGSFRKGRA